jgi:hypothetical protein
MTVSYVACAALDASVCTHQACMLQFAISHSIPVDYVDWLWCITAIGVRAVTCLSHSNSSSRSGSGSGSSSISCSRAAALQ